MFYFLWLCSKCYFFCSTFHCIFIYIQCLSTDFVSVVFNILVKKYQILLPLYEHIPSIFRPSKTNKNAVVSRSGSESQATTIKRMKNIIRFSLCTSSLVCGMSSNSSTRVRPAWRWTTAGCQPRSWKSPSPDNCTCSTASTSTTPTTTLERSTSPTERMLARCASSGLSVSVFDCVSVVPSVSVGYYYLPIEGRHVLLRFFKIFSGHLKWTKRNKVVTFSFIRMFWSVQFSLMSGMQVTLFEFQP